MKIANAEKRLTRFYGDVARLQNEDIIAFISGTRVLDIGCGYGNLNDQIKKTRRGVEVTGIDPDQESIDKAKTLYGIEVMKGSVYNMCFNDNSFDTVILRDVAHHLEGDGKLDAAFQEIRRVCAKEVIIFDPNPNGILRACRKLARHKDPEACAEKVAASLKKSGFRVETVKWRDVVAFPLSGGYVGLELVPNIGFIKRTVIIIDKWLNMALAKLGLQRLICWRYLIYARKEGR